jgi:hydroxymethylglutaryl-CoA reductase
LEKSEGLIAKKGRKKLTRRTMEGTQAILSISVNVMVTIFVTFTSLRSTTTNALPFVPTRVKSTVEALVTTLPLPSIVVVITGRTEVMLYP